MYVCIIFEYIYQSNRVNPVISTAYDILQTIYNTPHITKVIQLTFVIGTAKEITCEYITNI